MKIGLPVVEQGQDSKISAVLGRTDYFLIFDQTDETYNFIENEARRRPGGAGVQAAQLLVDQGVQVVITPQCGFNALQILKNAQIKLYRSIEGSVRDNLEAYAQGTLAPLSEDEQ